MPCAEGYRERTTIIWSQSGKQNRMSPARKIFDLLEDAVKANDEIRARQ